MCLITVYVKKNISFPFVTQYDDFEDSDGVTSEGEGLHNLILVKSASFIIHYFILHSLTPVSSEGFYVTLTVLAH